MPYMISLHERGGQLVNTQRDGTLEVRVPLGYRKHFDFSKLNGRRAGSTLGVMEHAIRKLGTSKGPDEYKPTKGNVGALVRKLHDWAKRFPDGVWYAVGG